MSYVRLANNSSVLYEYILKKCQEESRNERLVHGIDGKRAFRVYLFHWNEFGDGRQ